MNNNDDTLLKIIKALEKLNDSRTVPGEKYIGLEIEDLIMENLHNNKSDLHQRIEILENKLEDLEKQIDNKNNIQQW